MLRLSPRNAPGRRRRRVYGQHKLSRRALLGAVCAAPLVPRHAQSRHSGLDPESTFPSPARGGERWIPDQVRDDKAAGWDRALARFRSAQAEVDAATGEPDRRRYDALVDRADERMSALLALPAPDLAGMAVKLDIILPHRAWELTGSEDCLERLRQDAHRLAASAV